MKPVLQDAKRKIHDLLGREKQLSADLESAMIKEQAHIQENQALQSQVTQLNQEMSHYNQRFSLISKEIESYKKLISDLQSQMTELSLNNSAEKEHMLLMKEDLAKANQETIQALEKNEGLERLLQELRYQNQSLATDTEGFKNELQSQKNEQERLMMDKAEMSSTIQLQQQDLYDLQNRYKEQLLQLEAERASKEELRNHNSQTLNSVTKRINDLQATIKDTLLEVDQLKSTECQLREDIANRDEMIRNQEIDLLKLSKTATLLESQLTKQLHEFEDITNQRKKQVNKLHSTYEESKSGMYQELLGLERTLAEKTSEMTRIMESAAEANMNLSRVMTEKAALESRIAEHVAQEASLKRQLDHLNSANKTRMSDNARLEGKLKSLESQIATLEKELAIYRQERRQTGTEKITSSMNSLSKKLEEQVETLMDSY
jgi:chromosome segregation ATPase